MIMDDAKRWHRALAVVLGIGAFSLSLWYLLPNETDLQARVFCASLAFALALFVAVLCGRAGFGFLIAGAFGGCVWLGTTLKMAYLHEPLMAPDLHYFFNLQTLDVVAHYPGIARRCALVMLGSIALATFAWRLESPGGWHRRRWRTFLGCSLLALVPLGLVAWPKGPFRSVYAITTWDFIDHAQQDPATNFLRSFARMAVSAPAHDASAADRFDWGGAADPTTENLRPDIVAVLEESTLDPRQWAACTVARCNAALFQPDAATRAHGLLRVHTYGGGTWTSEFAFLAGLPHTLFGPAGVYAPYNLAPRMRESLPRQLKALGYRTIAIYPMPRDFVRAGDAYADYGFDEFHDAPELGLKWESSDSDVVHRLEDIRKRAHAQDDRPLFVMMLTMRQHGPHDFPLDKLPPPWNTPPLAQLDARTNRNVGTYLYRLKQSSDAMAELRQYLFADGKPAVLVHFGDHHPSFDGIEVKLASALPESLHATASQITYYRIDSNIPGTQFPDYAPLDLAFLGGLVLDAAHLPKDAYFEANTRLRERCDGHFADCADRSVLDSYLARVFSQLHVFAD